MSVETALRVSRGRARVSCASRACLARRFDASQLAAAHTVSAVLGNHGLDKAQRLRGTKRRWTWTLRSDQTSSDDGGGRAATAHSPAHDGGGGGDDARESGGEPGSGRKSAREENEAGVLKRQNGSVLLFFFFSSWLFFFISCLVLRFRTAVPLVRRRYKKCV